MLSGCGTPVAIRLGVECKADHKVTLVMGEIKCTFIKTRDQVLCASEHFEPENIVV